MSVFHSKVRLGKLAKWGMGGLALGFFLASLGCAAVGGPPGAGITNGGIFQLGIEVESIIEKDMENDNAGVSGIVAQTGSIDDCTLDGTRACATGVLGLNDRVRVIGKLGMGNFNLEGTALGLIDVEAEGEAALFGAIGADVDLVRTECNLVLGVGAEAGISGGDMDITLTGMGIPDLAGSGEYTLTEWSVSGYGVYDGGMLNPFAGVRLSGANLEAEYWFAMQGVNSEITADFSSEEIFGIFGGVSLELSDQAVIEVKGTVLDELGLSLTALFCF